MSTFCCFISCAIYIPLEVYHLIHHFLVFKLVSWMGVIVLGVNLAIVVYLWILLAADYQEKREKKKP